MITAIITSLAVVVCVNYVFTVQPFERIEYFIEVKGLSKWFKPVFLCPVCMTPYYTLAVSLAMGQGLITVANIFIAMAIMIIYERYA